MPEKSGFPSPVLVEQHRQEAKAQLALNRLTDQSRTLSTVEIEDISQWVEKNHTATSSEETLLVALKEYNPHAEQLLNQSEKVGKALVAESQFFARAHNFSQDVPTLIKPLETILSSQQQELLQTINQSDYIEDIVQALQTLGESLQNVQYQWSMVLREGLLRVEGLYQDKENDEAVELLSDINFLLNLQSFTDDLDRYLRPITDKTTRRQFKMTAFTQWLANQPHQLSPAILDDLVNERYDQSDPWISHNILESLEDYQEVAAKQEKRLSPTQKRLLAVVTAILIGVAVSRAGGNALNSSVKGLFQTDNQPYKPLVQKTPTPEVSTPTPAPSSDVSQTNNDKYQYTQTDGNGSSGEADGGSEGGSDRAEPDTPGGSSRPENSPGSSSPKKLWEIEGTIPNSYLRYATATLFNARTDLWSVDALYSYTDEFYPPREPQSAVTTLTSDFKITGPGEYLIPMPVTGYDIDFVKLPNASYGIIKELNGTILLDVQGIVDPAQVQVGLKTADNTQANDQPDKTDYDSQSLIDDVSQLPLEAQNLLKEVSSLSATDKAARIRDFVMNYFTYSRNPEYSDYFLARKGNGEYVRRVFAEPFGDCDVINTVNVGLLRAAGVPARLAYGFMNTNDLFNSDGSVVEGSERHGWAEFYDGEKWQVSDATPTRVDEYTQKILEKENGGKGITSINKLPTLEEILQMLKFSSLDFGDWVHDYGASTLISALFLSYVINMAGVVTRRSKQQDKIHDLKAKIKQSRPKFISTQAEDPIITKEINKKVNAPTWIDRRSPFWTWALRITGIPGAITNRKRGKLLKEALRRVETTDMSQYHEDDLFKLLTEVLQIEPSGMSKDIIRNNTQIFLAKTAYRFGRFLDQNLDKEDLPLSDLSSEFPTTLFLGNLVLRHLDHQGISDDETLLYYARGAKSKEVFINIIVNNLYQDYLRLDQKNHRKDKVTSPPFTLAEFTDNYLDAFMELDVYWDIYESGQKAIKRRTTEKAKTEKNSRLRKLLRRLKLEPKEKRADTDNDFS